LVSTPVERIQAVLEYDGTDYRGWQRQADARTVQSVCEATLAQVLQVPVGIVAAGRTDTGVHARGQVVHFDHATRLGTSELRRAWNARLPDDIWVARLTRARPDFHARFDARTRTYRYRLALGERAASPFVRRYAWPIRGPLDWAGMEQATAKLLGEHDFRPFAKGPRGGAREPGRCRLFAARWRRTAEGRALEVTADRFLRHMVRALVGVVVAVGKGRVAVSELERALAGEIPRPAVTYAPPRGLFLWRVDYGGNANDDSG
jgi:tRNA pseudouridine38-40 synthase